MSVMLLLLIRAEIIRAETRLYFSYLRSLPPSYIILRHSPDHLNFALQYLVTFTKLNEDVVSLIQSFLAPEEIIKQQPPTAKEWMNHIEPDEFAPPMRIPVSVPVYGYERNYRIYDDGYPDFGSSYSYNNYTVHHPPYYSTFRRTDQTTDFSSLYPYIDYSSTFRRMQLNLEEFRALVRLRLLYDGIQRMTETFDLETYD